MTETAIADPLEYALQIELESIQSEISSVQARLERLEVEQQAAVNAEGAALQEAARMHAWADPLVMDTGREHVSQQEEAKVIQVGIVVGDSLWRVNYPAAAQALGQAQAADRAVQLASAHTIRLGQLHQDLEYRVLPHLNARANDKQKELEQHRQAQHQARQRTTDRTWLDEFRRKLRGES